MKLSLRTALLIWSMLMCGLISVYLGKELSWDLANYHYYGPFSYLRRGGLDFWPTTYVHQFINPTIDLLSYYLINNVRAISAEFILGMLSGINIFLLVLIAQLFLPKIKSSFYVAFLLAIFGLCGPTAIPGIGSFQNDNVIAIFVLTYVYLQLRALQMPKDNLWVMALAGFVLGLGVGLKLTATIFLLGGGMAILFLPAPLRIRLKTLSVLFAFSFFGIILIAGNWMLLLWEQYHNPLFPFFNKIFHAEQFAQINWRDTRFLPKDIWQTLFYPFYFAFDGKRIADGDFQDLRFPILYLLYLFVFLKWFWQKATTANDPLKRWLIFFFIFSYIIWQYYFSIARYMASLEMLAPLLIYLLLSELIVNGTQKIIATTMVFYSILFFLVPLPMVRAPWYQGDFFNVQLPKMVSEKKNALVFMTYTAYVMDIDPRPQTYLIASFPRHWRFVGVPFWHGEYLQDEQSAMLIKKMLTNYDGDIYLLTSQMTMPIFSRAMQQFGLRVDGECSPIISDRQKISNEEVSLCKAVSI